MLYSTQSGGNVLGETTDDTFPGYLVITLHPWYYCDDTSEQHTWYISLPLSGPIQSAIMVSVCSLFPPGIGCISLLELDAIVAG